MNMVAQAFAISGTQASTDPPLCKHIIQYPIVLTYSLTKASRPQGHDRISGHHRGSHPDHSHRVLVHQKRE
jgi:hypothetical protein